MEVTRPQPRSRSLVVALVLTLACAGATEELLPDASLPGSDAGASEQLADAGDDAGAPDAATDDDAGLVADAGLGDDAGTADDAGLTGDAGLTDDAGQQLALVPDFSLEDDNPNSTSFGQKVSPRQFVGKVSAWYFGHIT